MSLLPVRETALRWRSRPRLQPSLHDRDQRLPDRRVLDELERLAEERLEQQALGLRLRQAAGLQVEQQVLIESAAGRAMRADHVVGEDLELGLVVHRAALAEQ